MDGLLSDFYGRLMKRKRHENPRWMSIQFLIILANLNQIKKTLMNREGELIYFDSGLGIVDHHASFLVKLVDHIEIVIGSRCFIL
jgi:hypothetical protein